MDFLELQDSVLEERFGEHRRADVKRWINYRYGRLWSTEDWAFKRAIGSVTLPNGQNTVALTGFQRILGLWDASVVPYTSVMDAIRPEDFYARAGEFRTIPLGFTLIGNTLHFDRQASGNRTFTIVGELAFEELVADGDVPLIPVEFHQTIVSGASAQGLREENDPTWKDLEADFQAGVDDMKKGYLNTVRHYADHAPSWP